jgi:hypothetical protein
MFVEGHTSTSQYVAAGMQTLTLAAAQATFAITSNFMEITGDAGTNVIGTITGASAGQELTLKFVDGLVSIVDNGTGTADTINLSAAFASSANDILKLIYDGTSWFEVSRSVN